jgi:UDP-N-acetylmuramoylalanine--D-glutamate ligase
LKRPSFIAILGAGESGTGAALLAFAKGFDVLVSDIKSIKPEYKAALQAKGIPFEEGYHSEDRIFEADLIIKSPGIPDGIELIRNLRAAGKSVIDEVEFASRYTDAKIIAITGSNGKTTTTKLIWHILQTAGYNVGLGGNIGYSAAKQVQEFEHDWLVWELSSFQLDGCTSLKPFVSVLTNITPDHLDRYGYKLERYVASKFRICQSQDENDHFVFNSGNENVIGYFNAHQTSIKAQKHPLLDIQIETDTELVVGNFRILKTSLPIEGRHNMHNAACAVTAALLAGVPHEAIAKALQSFQPEPHRMEKVAVLNGVQYINDSKATNVDSVFFALDAMTQPTVWIAGGQDKGNDYEVLLPLAKAKVKALICMGVDNKKLIEAFSGIVPVVEEASSADEAVQKAAALAQPGDTVMLSPACASFDLFKNYMDRGEQFREAVLQLV